MNVSNPRRALVIDDQVMVAMEIEDILKEQGFEVVSVCTRAQLDGALAHGPYAVVVTDTDLADHLEIQGWGGKVIMCSGKTQDVLEQQFPGLALLANRSEPKTCWGGCRSTEEL